MSDRIYKTDCRFQEDRNIEVTRHGHGIRIMFGSKLAVSRSVFLDQSQVGDLIQTLTDAFPVKPGAHKPQAFTSVNVQALQQKVHDLETCFLVEQKANASVVESLRSRVHKLEASWTNDQRVHDRITELGVKLGNRISTTERHITRLVERVDIIHKFATKFFNL